MKTKALILPRVLPFFFVRTTNTLESSKIIAQNQYVAYSFGRGGNKPTKCGPGYKMYRSRFRPAKNSL